MNLTRRSLISLSAAGAAVLGLRGVHATAARLAAVFDPSSLMGGGTLAQMGPVPLGDALAVMAPRSVWQHFYDLTQVPRPSHHEERATAFIADFGRHLGLDTIVDSAGNVIIRKPATTARKGSPGVVLQAHLDMVPQKTPESTHDFQVDPIAAFVVDGWVRAAGTTLGADNGIGVAIIMALLEADDVVHGPLEALFTVNEEDGQTGINALAPDALRGRLYINLDNEVEGQFVISSAGAVNVEAQATYDQVATPPTMTGLQVTIAGLLGGHSGIDIDKGRGSAHQLMARLLVDAAAFDVRLADLVGGDTPNVIPRKATAVVALPVEQAEVFRAYVDGFAATVAGELATTDPEVTVTVIPVDLPSTVMEAAAQAALIGAVHALPQGVLAMSADVPGLVQTSSNLGVLNIGHGRFTGTALVRSALNAERDTAAQRVAAVFEQAGAGVALGEGYLSWPPNPASPLLELMQAVYTDLFGVTPTVTAVHAGLETSAVGVIFPGMDMISVGPTMLNGHSPDERLEVASVPRVYELLVATLRRIETST